MSIIHFLHVSDLHFNKIGFETEVMREKLPDYINSIQKEGLPFNYIFFTGDLRFAPLKDYPTCVGEYFRDLCDAAEVKREDLYVAIGNHDVIRGDIDRLSAIEEVEKNYDASDRVIDEGKIRFLKSGRREYYELLNQIVSSEQYALHSSEKHLHFVMKTKDINIVIVDSTISYREDKEGEFFIGAYNLKKVLEKCNKKKPTIVLSHYAMDSLETTEQKAVLRTIKDHHIQLWLAGHKHNDIIRKELDYVYTAQSGNQTYEKGTSPGFIEGILDTELGCGHFCVHKWNPSAGWGLYQTLIDVTDKKDNIFFDKTKYRFVLEDWRRVNNITEKYELDIPCSIMSYFLVYNGRSFYLDTLVRDINVSQSEILLALEVLKKEGYVKPLNYEKTHWEILKRYGDR